jgi:hypothetical protein
LKQAGWSVEGGIEVFFSLGMQGGSVLDTRAIEQLYLKYKGAQQQQQQQHAARVVANLYVQLYRVARGRSSGWRLISTIRGRKQQQERMHEVLEAPAGTVLQMMQGEWQQQHQDVSQGLCLGCPAVFCACS